MDINPFDFMPSEDALFDNFSAEVKNMLLPFGKNKAGCLICYWLSSKDKDECPIVWIDSEGEPNAVFATNLSVFFSLLPYSTGAIYDMIIASERHIQNPESNQSPKELFSGIYKEHSAQNQESGSSRFEKKLNELLDIKIAKNPTELVLKASKQFREITERINKNRV